nr:hypothetical protein Iba_chr07dCG3090 [Ipomoea batatas]
MNLSLVKSKQCYNQLCCIPTCCIQQSSHCWTSVIRNLLGQEADSFSKRR